MDIGPVSYTVIAFPGNRFTGKIAPELEKLIANGVVRIIDLVFVAKDGDGNTVGFELEDIGDEGRAFFDPLVDDLEQLISDEDVADLSEALEPDSSAAIMIFEHAWAVPFRDALVNSGGELVARLPIPPAVLDEIAAARA